MEHRHFPRKPFQLTALLLTTNGKIFPAKVLDLCAIGMRVAVNQPLPERIKVVDVLFSGTNDQLDPTYRMRMFVVHKGRLEVGLCLVNERSRIDIDWQRQDEPDFSCIPKVVGY